MTKTQKLGLEEGLATELTLLVLYLSGWEEDSQENKHEKDFRCWIKHSFQYRDNLDKMGLLAHHPHPAARTCLLTKAGQYKAEELKKKYLKINQEDSMSEKLVNEASTLNQGRRCKGKDNRTGKVVTGTFIAYFSGFEAALIEGDDKMHHSCDAINIEFTE